MHPTKEFLVLIFGDIKSKFGTPPTNKFKCRESWVNAPGDMTWAGG